LNNRKVPYCASDSICEYKQIVDALLKDLKETEESFCKNDDEVKRRILDYHSVMIHAVLNTTLHSEGLAK